jgi:hypothetical protein
MQIVLLRMEMEDLELTPNHKGEEGVDADLQTQSI